MLGDKFKVKKIENSFEITNISGNLLENCLIYVRDIYSKDIVKQVTDFYQTKARHFR